MDGKELAVAGDLGLARIIAELKEAQRIMDEALAMPLHTSEPVVKEEPPK